MHDIFLIKNLVLLAYLSTVGLGMLYNMKYKYNYEYKKQRNAIILFLAAENFTLVLFTFGNILPPNDQLNLIAEVYSVSKLRTLI